MALCNRLEFAGDVQPVFDLRPAQLDALQHLISVLELPDGLAVVDCVCGATEGLEIASRDGWGLPLGTFLCERCGMLRTNPSPTGRAERRAFAELLWNSASNETLYEVQRKLGQRLAQDMRELEIEASLVRQVGCLTGGTLAAFQAPGVALHGIERTFPDRAEFGIRQGLTIDTHDARVPNDADLLLSIHELEHAANPVSELRRLRSMVRPGGFMLIRVSGLYAGLDVLDGNLLGYLSEGRRWHFTADTLRAVIAAAGLEVMYSDEQSFAFARVPRSEEPDAPPAWTTSSHAQATLHAIADAERRFRGIDRQRASSPAMPQRSAAADDCTVFFCIGTRESGADLVARVLDGHPDAACLRDSYAMQPSAPSSILNPASDQWRVHGFCEDQVRGWAEAPHFAQVMPELLADFAKRMGGNVVGDQWPFYIDYLDPLMRAFPDAKLVYTVRDPRAVWSQVRAETDRAHADKELSELLEKDRAIGCLRGHPNLLTVRVEDLICNPPETIRELHGFLHLTDPADPELARSSLAERWGALEDVSTALDPRTTTEWRHRMKPKEVRRISQQARWFIEKYGYG
ncbi:MAG: sulfotransferase [Myxococcota bacterium]